MPGDDGAQVRPDPLVQAAPEEAPGLPVASVAQKIVDPPGPIEADIHPEPGMAHQMTREAGGEGPAGDDLDGGGVFQGRLQDGGQIGPGEWLSPFQANPFDRPPTGQGGDDRPPAAGIQFRNRSLLHGAVAAA